MPIWAFAKIKTAIKIAKVEFMKKLSTSARVTEVDTLSDVLVRLYKADSALAKDEFLAGVMAEIEQQSSGLTTAIKQDKALSTLDGADSERDEAIRNFAKLIDGYSAFPLPAKRNAAEQLLTVFAKYRKTITGESYANESSLIESMLEDFASADLTLAISELEGVDSLLKGIREAQNAFNTLNDEYVALCSAKGKSATLLKRPLVTLINEKFVTYVGAMALANASLYADFASKAETEINRINDAVRGRASKPQA